jgi:hypothetical protein
MYYTGIHPMTGKKVYVTTDYHEKQLQRALLQFSRPENANLVREALRMVGREDLIGNSPECLVRPAFGQSGRAEVKVDKKTGKIKKPTGKGGFGASTAYKGSSRPSSSKGAKGKGVVQNRQGKGAFSTAEQRKPTKSNKNARKGR